MKYDIEKLKEIQRRNPAVATVFFWRHTPGPEQITDASFSQWYDCYFEVDGVRYHTAEQYMMASKARLFGDEEVFAQIMQTDNPHQVKKFGRLIRAFQQEQWDEAKYAIVVKGNKAKFSQNPELKKFLLSTGDAILAEASPYDKIWGIGLDKEHAETGTVDQWQGENLLGCALMEVRDWLRQQNNAD